MVTQPLTVKQIRGKLSMEKLALPYKVWQKWHNDLEIAGVGLQWDKITAIAFQIQQIKIRSFYLKYINRCYMTNVVLQKFGRSASPNCTFCGMVVETCIHMYWECSQVQHLWRQVIRFCQLNIDALANYDKVHCVLLGFDKPTLNLVMTCTKYTIHIARLYKTQLALDIVLKKVNRAMSQDRYTAFHFSSMSQAKYHALWGPLDQYTFPEIAI